jgi:hypothetical protein
MFYVFVEFDGPYGRSRMTRGFTSEAAREEWASKQHPLPEEGWSDYEEWEAPQSEWPTVQIIG